MPKVDKVIVRFNTEPGVDLVRLEQKLSAYLGTDVTIEVEPDGHCPHCSFDPTSRSDYCDKHRPR